MFLHNLLLVVLPITVYVVVSLDFAWIGVVLVLMSKWRIFAVKSRHWPALIRANAVDILVGLSIVAIMDMPVATTLSRALLALAYCAWLIAIKPRGGPIWIGTQALIAQSLSTSAIFIQWTSAETTWLVAAVWLVTYLCARHFLSAFDEQMSRATAYTWALFAAAVTWLSSHWLLMYGGYIAMPALLLNVLGYCLAVIYYLDHADRLQRTVRWQLVGLMVIAVLSIIIFSNWQIITPG